MFNRSVIPTWYANETCLCSLGLLSSVHWVLNKLELTHFCALSNPTYVNLTLAFLSSFDYYTPMVSRNTIGTMKFRMFNRECEFSQDHIADLLQFPHGDDISCEGPLEGE